MSYTEVNPRYCKGCQRCISVCPKKCLELSGKSNDSGYNYVQFVQEAEADCTGCAMCRQVCPDIAITVHKE